MLMTTILGALLAVSLILLAYIYVGYPLLLRRLAREQGSQASPVPTGEPPLTMSMVIVACNERLTLPGKLVSVLNSTVGENLIEILIGSDGSTDGTPDVVRELDDPRVRVIEFATRRGKPAVLNDLVPLCRGELIVFADARQSFHPETLEKLRARFADPRVGVVSGELVLTSSGSSSSSAEGVGFYWKYEKWIRRQESDYRGVPGATGACYAARRELLRPLPPNTLLDDVVIPMQVVEQGYRCCFESGAEIYDRASETPRQEAIRKRRTIAGAAQLIRNHPQWLLPWRNPLWFEYVSHKLLRLASPVLLAIALIANAALLDIPALRVLFSMQICGYIAAGVGWMYQRAGRRSTCFGPCLMFLTMNLTTMLALWDAWRDRYQVTWARSDSSRLT